MAITFLALKDFQLNTTSSASSKPNILQIKYVSLKH